MRAAGKRRLWWLIIAGCVVALWIGLTIFTRLTYAPRPQPERLGTQIDAPYQVLQFAIVSVSTHWPWDSQFTVKAEFAMPDGVIVNSTSRVNLIGRDWWNDLWLVGLTTPEYPNAVRTVDFLFDYEGTSYHYQVDVFFRFNPAVPVEAGPNVLPGTTASGNTVSVHRDSLRQVP